MVGFLTSFFVTDFLAFAADLAAGAFLAAGILFAFFLGDVVFVADFLGALFLRDVVFVAADFFAEEVCFLTAGFLTTAFFSALAFFFEAVGFVDGLFCSLASLNDPDAPTPLVWINVPSSVPFFRATLT